MDNEKLRTYLTPLDTTENRQSVSKLLELTLSFLLNPSQVDYQNQLGELTTEFSELNATSFKAFAHGTLVFLNDILSRGMEISYLKSRCEDLELREDTVKQIAGIWRENSSKIANYLCSKVISKNRLVDMDWSFGVTAGSDDCDHVGKTYLQLKLTLDHDLEGRKIVFLELTLDQFYQFLASLEKCRTFIDYVST